MQLNYEPVAYSNYDLGSAYQSSLAGKVDTLERKVALLTETIESLLTTIDNTLMLNSGCEGKYGCP